MNPNKTFVPLTKEQYQKLTKNQKKRYKKKKNKASQAYLILHPEVPKAKQKTKVARGPINQGNGVQKLEKKKKTLETAPISLNIVQAICDFCPTAFEFSSLGIMSILSSKIDHIDDSIYGAYFAWQTDFFNIITGATPIIKDKLHYVSCLYNCIAPKTITTRTAAYKFTWNPFGPVVPSKVLPLRGNNYYFYKPNGSDPIVTPELCVPMNISGLEEAIGNYNSSLDLLSGQKSALQVLPYDKVTSFIRDASAFAASAPSVGAGACTSSGTYGSGELEMPCTSIPTLAQFNEFSSPSDRTSRFLRPTAGDPCLAFTYPYIPDFDMDNYRTVHTPKIKYIDFAEVWVVYATWVAESISKSLASNLINIAVVPPVPLAAAIGALIQTIKTYFMASQCGTQFSTYDKLGNLFEPFRMCPNVCPKVGQGLLLPVPLVENLRFLHAQVFENPNEVNHNKKNAIIYIPCFGLNTRSVTWYNPSYYDQSGVAFPVFDDSSGLQNDINWIDGSLGNDVINMNSKYFLGAISTLNELSGRMSTVEGSIAYLAGTPSTSLLPYTRFYNETELDLKTISKYPKWLSLPQGFERRKIIRTNSNSKKEMKDDYEIVKLTNSGTEHLTTEVPFRVNCMFPIRQEVMSILQYFILPAISSLETGNETAQKLDPNKFMTVYSEYNFTAFATSNQEFISPTNMQTILSNNGRAMAAGIAQPGGVTEMSRALDILGKLGKGAFLSDLFSTIGGIAGSLGI